MTAASTTMTTDSANATQRARTGRWSQLAVPLALSLGTGAAGLSFSVAQADPTESAEGRMLSVLAAAVVACASFAAQLGGGEDRGAGKWLAVPATGSTLALAGLWFLHQGPHRGGAISLVLTATLAACLLRSWPRVSRGAYGPCIVWATSAALGVQLLVRPHLLLPASIGSSDFWFFAVALPAIFGTLLGLVAGGLGRVPMLAGVAVLLLGPGLDVPRAVQLGPALVLALGAVWLWRRSGAGRRGPAATGGLARLQASIESFLAAAVLVAGALVIVLASYPWMRPAPWAELPGLVPARTLAVPLERGPVVLRADAPIWGADLPADLEIGSGGLGSGVIGSVVIDSSLVHGLDATGEHLATLRLISAGAVEEIPLVGGVHTADWASGRRDVALREGFRAPAPWSQTVSADGSFFASRFRAVLRPARSLAAGRIEIELHAEARPDPQIELHLARVELRR